MSDYTATLAKDLQARLDEVNRALSEFDALIAERRRLEAAIKALEEPAQAPA
jgi:hypothetical protein